MLEKRLDLTTGKITPIIFKLSIPIFLTAFLQMAYNLVDMIWISKLGYRAVSAVGTAGYYMWLSSGLVFISKIGAEIGVSQSLGEKNEENARKYSVASIQFAIILGLIVSSIMFFFAEPLILFFNIETPIVNEWGIKYLKIIAFGEIFHYLQMALLGIYTGAADSKTPFYISFVGLALNMILDPIFIFGYKFIPALGVEGAALATILSEFLVFIIFVFHLKTPKAPFKNLKVFNKINYNIMKKIINYGLPVSFQSVAFTIFAMIMARALSHYGDIPISVQKVGSQIESISWMTTEGFQSAICAFIGQNYGSKNYERIKKGYFISMIIVICIGILATFLLMVFPKQLFGLFSNNDNTMLNYGVKYLEILALSQVFMAVEITTTGAFNGMGKTLFPSIISFIFTGLRVPFAYLFINMGLALESMWWIISISTILKGIITGISFPIWFNTIYMKNTGKNIFKK